MKTRILIRSNLSSWRWAPALARRPDEFERGLIHAGQHYDNAMSRIVLDEFKLGRPDPVLDVSSGSDPEQIAGAFVRAELERYANGSTTGNAMRQEREANSHDRAYSESVRESLGLLQRIEDSSEHCQMR